MRKLSVIIFIIWLFSTSVFSQKAKKLDEFGKLHCGTFMAYVSQFSVALRENVNSKLYVVYYGEKDYIYSTKDKSGKEAQLVIKPHPEDAFNRAKEIPLFLRTAFNISEDKIILIDGGFREKLTFEIWLVSKGDNLPKPTPTVDRRDVKFSENRRYGTRDCSKAYDNDLPSQEARLFDEFSNISCDDMLGRLDVFAVEITDSLVNSVGYVIVYEGKYKRPVYNKKGNFIKNETLLPTFGESTERTHTIMNHLLRLRAFPREKLVFINGGFREFFTVQLWIVSKGADLPEITPTLKKIKYRKGTPGNICQEL